MEILKNNLIKLRETKGLTQKEVAKALDVSLQTYKKWEVGEINPHKFRFKYLVGIAVFYNVSIHYLIGD